MIRLRQRHGRLSAEGLKVRTHEAVGDLGQVLHLHIRGQRHASTVNIEDLEPAVAIGNGDRDLPIRTSRACEARHQEHSEDSSLQ